MNANEKTESCDAPEIKEEPLDYVENITEQIQSTEGATSQCLIKAEDVSELVNLLTQSQVFGESVRPDDLQHILNEAPCSSIGLNFDGIKVTRYNCHHCEKSFLRWSGLRQHINAEHTKSKQTLYKCNLCGLQLSADCTLSRHLRLKHFSSKIGGQSQKESRVSCEPYRTQSRNNSSILLSLLTEPRKEREYNYKPCPVCKNLIECANFSEHLQIHSRQKESRISCEPYRTQSRNNSSRLLSRLTKPRKEREYNYKPCPVCKNLIECASFSEHLQMHSRQKESRVSCEPYRTQSRNNSSILLSLLTKPRKEIEYNYKPCPVCKNMIECASLSKHLQIHSRQKESRVSCEPYRAQARNNSSRLLALLTKPRKEREHNYKPCPVCKKLIECAYLSKHLQIHSRQRERPSMCSVCGKAYYNEKNLLQHMDTHSTVKKHSCTLCEKRFKLASSLRSHILDHSRVLRFVCGHCTKPFYKKNQLKDHVETHFEEARIYRCEICNSGFYKKGLLKEHLRIHTNERPYGCDQCSLRFKRLSTLRAHKESHSSVKFAMCDICGKQLKRKYYLRVHKQNVHGDKPLERPFVCEQCGRRFTHLAVLKQHITTHTGEKRFQCLQCLKRFASNERLKSHSVAHGDVRAYCCNLCTKTFRFENNRRWHLLSHTNVRKFSCTKCDKWFKLLHHLKAHLTTHSRERAYKCDLCPKLYMSRSALSHHIKTHKNAYQCWYCKKFFPKKVLLRKHIVVHYRRFC